VEPKKNVDGTKKAEGMTKRGEEQARCSWEKDHVFFVTHPLHRYVCKERKTDRKKEKLVHCKSLPSLMTSFIGLNYENPTKSFSVIAFFIACKWTL
jgi:hypothetical protein